MTTSHGSENNRWASEAKESPRHLPKIINKKAERWTVTPGKPTTSGVRVSMFEAVRPNEATRVVSRVDQTIGEKPEVPFMTLRDYRDRTPQIDTIIEYTRDLIVGTGININADDDEAKALMEKFANDCNLHDKISNLVDQALEGGTALFVRVLEAGYLVNIEEFDMTMMKRVHRDMFGNPQFFVIDGGNGTEEKIKNIKEFVPLIFKQRGRDYFGRSMFHSMAVTRTVGNRTTRPLVEALWSLDDVVIGTLENFAYPVEYHIFENINADDLEEEAEKYKEGKPGDKFFVNRPHTIDRREPAKSNFEPFVQHLSNSVQLGLGFPLEILLGDFTSRAASENTDSLMMRKIRAEQKKLLKTITRDIFEFLLLHHPESKWKTQQAVDDLNVDVEFDTQNPMEYTVDQVLARVNASLWTKAEGREYDKGNGQDLFDDDKIEQDEEINQQMKQDQMDQGPRPEPPE